MRSSFPQFFFTLCVLHNVIQYLVEKTLPSFSNKELSQRIPIAPTFIEPSGHTLGEPRLLLTHESVSPGCVGIP